MTEKQEETGAAPVCEHSQDEKCPDCGGLIKIRNPTGKCDHLYYPENKTDTKPFNLSEEIIILKEHVDDSDWDSKEVLLVWKVKEFIKRLKDEFCTCDSLHKPCRSCKKIDKLAGEK